LLPMNLCAPGQSADYLVTGSWSKKAYKTAASVIEPNLVADAAASSYTDVPPLSEWKLSPDAAYFHMCQNETIGGVEFHELPDTGKVPIVCDMSSTILSRPIDVNRFAVIYAGAQKNIGPAGLTIIIARKDLIEKGGENLPPILRYQNQAAAGSMSNTPPTFAWYLSGLVFKWIKRQGGLQAMGELNKRKSNLLYSAIDGSDFYSNPVALPYRSWMNIPFTLAKPELDGQFLAEAEKVGLMNLKGHRSVGGMRASIYNAVSEEAVQALVDFMAEFEKRNA